MSYNAPLPPKKGFTTDKVTRGYLPDYMLLASKLPKKAVICELGVQHGDSLKMWQALCPEARVIGVDNNPKSVWPEGAFKIIGSQIDDHLDKLVEAYAPDGCDLILDDASHIGSFAMKAFKSLWPLVRSGGYYVIEDWADSFLYPDLMRWPDVDPSLTGNELVDVVPSLISALQDGATFVTYTKQGLVVMQKE